MNKEVLLAYPNFTKKFHIHTDASKTQLGAVISHEGKPVAYSRKLSPAQPKYTTTERELLAIVETLKEVQNILLGQQIVVCTDHKNLNSRKYNLSRFSDETAYLKIQSNFYSTSRVTRMWWQR